MRIGLAAPIALVVVLALAQVVPYGRSHTNPPVTGEPAWDSPQTRELVARACYDCHSNETVWPWYSNLAPVSWLVQRDVMEARHKLNFSEWDQPQREAKKLPKIVSRGEMPPWLYTIPHTNARLTDTEREQLVQGLQATLGSATAQNPGSGS